MFACIYSFMLAQNSHIVHAKKQMLVFGSFYVHKIQSVLFHWQFLHRFQRFHGQFLHRFPISIVGFQFLRHLTTKVKTADTGSHTKQ